MLFARFFRRIILIFIVLCFSLEAKPPELTPKVVRVKIEEILKAHAAHNKLSNEILKRTLNNFLEELDPTKTYLLASELDPWKNPTEDLLQKSIIDLKKGNFSIFEQIHNLMIKAIERRNKFEAYLENAELLKKEEIEQEAKNLEWVKTSDELYNRLLMIKSLQMQIAGKLIDENQDHFCQRLKKRRLNRESDILAQSAEDKKKLIYSYILKSFTAALDAHTNYFTPIEASQFMIEVQQRLFGIGAQLKDCLNGFSIVRILEGGPASHCKELKINDKIIAVDHEPVIGMDITEAVELIRGEKNTKVLLTVHRETSQNKKEKFDVEITRGEVVLEETRLETSIEPFADGVIAHLKLFSFYQDPNSSSASDIKKSIETLQKKHNLKGVVLDLRNNAGGLLPQAVVVSGLFIKKGIVVSIKDSSERIQHLRAIDGKITWDGPLVVLTNKASASAAEIVAQTLQDYGRALVVGDKHTFGKGTFQTFTLEEAHDGKVNSQGEYKVTKGKYYTVSGKSPQLVGVKADIVIPGILSELDIGEEFAKYPLPNDQIDPNFDDDLSDIPLIHRNQVGRLYKHNLQTKIDIFNQHLPLLKANSEKRLLANKNFQNFLTEIKEKHFDNEIVEMMTHSDFQLNEAYNVMKDLIFLMQVDEKTY